MASEGFDIQTQPPSPGGFSAADWSITLAIAAWALAWDVVAYVAMRRLARSDDGYAILGAATSVLVASVATWVMWRLVRGHCRAAQDDPAPPKPPTPPESPGRKFTGWIVAAAWTIVGVVWNVGIFEALLQAANSGRGLMLTVLVLWSVVGLIPGVVGFVSVGVIIDWVLKRQ